MYLESFFLYGTVIVGVCMALLILVFAYLFLRISRALSSSQKEFTQYKNEHEIEAHKAIEEATKKAQAIIADSELFTEEVKKTLSDTIKKSVDSGASLYSSLLAEVQNKTLKELTEVASTFEKQAEQSLSEMTKDVSLEMKKNKEELNSEMSKTKEEQLTTLKKSILSMLPEVLSEATANSLSQEEQEKVALEAIQKIKNKYVL